MKKRRQRVTPRSVLARARKKSSPLHDVFEWDDENAMVALGKVRSVSIVPDKGGKRLGNSCMSVYPDGSVSWSPPPGGLPGQSRKAKAR